PELMKALGIRGSRHGWQRLPRHGVADPRKGRGRRSTVRKACVLLLRPKAPKEEQHQSPPPRKRDSTNYKTPGHGLWKAGTGSPSPRPNHQSVVDPSIMPTGSDTGRAPKVGSQLNVCFTGCASGDTKDLSHSTSTANPAAPGETVVKGAE